MKTIKIISTKYNEVSPSSIQSIINSGGKIIKSQYSNGLFIGCYGGIKVYSDDSIIINNVTLPLSINAVYDRELIINIKEENRI